MATTATSEAIEVRRRGRQRLIGAVALVALLVVFVPMLLDKEPKPARPGPDLAIPSRDSAAPMVLPPAAKPAGEAPAVQAAPAPAVPPAAAPAPPKAAETKPAPTAESKPAPAEAKPAPAAETKPAVAAAKPTESKTPQSKTPQSKPAAEAKPAVQPPKPGFAVQVGAFRDEAKLKQARDKLAAARIPHYTERLDTQGGNLTRLRAGPFDTREQAEAALAALKRSSLDGKVVPLP